jgi:four helix bundle protein
MESALGGGLKQPLRYEVLEDAVAIVELARPLVEVINRKDRDLASQVRRAVSSITLNLGEAFGNAGGNARLRFETARGSLYEAQVGIRTAVAWGYFEHERCRAILAAMDALGGRVYGLAKSV